MIGSKFLIPEEVREEFSLFEKNIKENSKHKSEKRKALSKELYLYTKNLLKTQGLDGNQKREILDLYIQTWENAECLLPLNNTNYKKYANKSYMRTYPYNKLQAMMAGFDLSGLNATNLKLRETIFIAVNFQNADFSNVSFESSHFEDCTLSHIKTTEDTSLYQCLFKGCDLTGTDLSGARVSNASFTQSILLETKILEHRLARYIWMCECIGHSDEHEFNSVLYRFEQYKLIPVGVTPKELLESVELHGEIKAELNRLKPG